MTNTGIKGRVLRAVGAEVLSQGLNIGIRLLLIPLFLIAWGAPVYGEWLILTALASWFGLGDLGGQIFFVNELTSVWAVGNKDEFQKILATGMLLFLSTSTILFLGVSFALVWPGWLFWFGLKIVSIPVAQFVLILMAFKFLVTLPLGLLLGVFRAIGSQATSVMYTNAMLAIQFIGSIIALHAGAGLKHLALLEVLPALFISFFILSSLKNRLHPDIKLFALKKADLTLMRSALLPSLHFLVIQLALAVMIQGSVIVIGKVLGPVQVAIFSTMRSVSNIVARFPAMISHSVWPELTRLHSRGEHKKLSKLFIMTLSTGFIMGLVYLVLLRGFGAAAFDLWLKNKLEYDPNAMFLMGCFVVLTTLWTLGGNLFMATNQHEHYARIQLGVNIFALLLCGIMAIKIGLSGAVAGLILGQSIPMVVVVIVLLKQKNWVENAIGLGTISFIAIIIFPFCLNVWTGGIAVIVISLIMVQTVFEVRLYPQR